MSKGTNAKIAVQKASTADAFLGGYSYRDDDGDCVQSEAVTLTDACGTEILGPRPAATSIPVVATSLSSTLQAGKEIAVTGVAALVIPGNAFRTTALVQNTGSANVRVGAAGVTPTTGYRLAPNQTIVYGEPNVNKSAIWAVREGGIDSVVFVQEETITISASPDVINPPADDDDATS